MVCPPPANAAGNWSVKADEESIEARFTAADNPEQLLGFALQGKAVTQRQAMAALVPAVLA